MGLRFICLWVTVVRHAETELSTAHPRILQGQTDTSLTVNGRKQAEALAWRLAKEDFDHIISSDLSRCKETTEIIAKYHRECPVKYDARLREKDLGDLAGESWTDAKHLLKQKNTTLEDHVSLTGESPESFEDRVVSIYSELVETYLLDPNRLPYSSSEERLGDLARAACAEGGDGEEEDNVEDVRLETPVGTEPPRTAGRRESMLASASPGGGGGSGGAGGEWDGQTQHRHPHQNQYRRPSVSGGGRSPIRTISPAAAAAAAGSTSNGTGSGYAASPTTATANSINDTAVRRSSHASPKSPALPSVTVTPASSAPGPQQQQRPSLPQALKRLSIIQSSPTSPKPSTSSPRPSQGSPAAKPKPKALPVPQMRQVHLLLVTHGGPIRELFTHLTSELKFVVQGRVGLHGFPKETGVSRFVISRVNQSRREEYDWEGRVALYNCVSHLAGFGKGGRGLPGSAVGDRKKKVGGIVAGTTVVKQQKGAQQQAKQVPQQQQIQGRKPLASFESSDAPRTPPTATSTSISSSSSSNHHSSRSTKPAKDDASSSSSNQSPSSSAATTTSPNVKRAIFSAGNKFFGGGGGNVATNTNTYTTNTPGKNATAMTKEQESVSPSSPSSGVAFIGSAPAPVPQPRTNKGQGRSLGW